MDANFVAENANKSGVPDFEIISEPKASSSSDQQQQEKMEDEKMDEESKEEQKSEIDKVPESES